MFNRGHWKRKIFKNLSESQFNIAARELFAWQYSQCAPYRRLAQGRNIHPKSILSWRDIPAVSQELFKKLDFFCYPTQKAIRTFQTSGTTTGQKGKAYLLKDDLYQAAALAGIKKLFPKNTDFYFLAAPPNEAKHSSLSWMFKFWRKEIGAASSRFWVKKDQLNINGLRNDLEKRILKKKPLVLCGTAFSFVHLIDAWKSSPIPLPKGSIILETGGFKGKSRELKKSEFYRALTKLFGVKDSHIWNEYGMTELSSQAYARGVNGCHQPPPWTRVLVIDPKTEREVSTGKTGLIRWIDLANVDSVLAIQTHDLAIRKKNGFQLLGRAPALEPRGCSLTGEQLQLKI
jgi:phenylacetate-coenzyme A ligase PaaK-like adenylate-forming protein